MIISCILVLLAAALLSAGLVPQPETRIINGRDMDIKEVPWQVSLQFQGRHFCGGSIYSENIIITAAHCFYNRIGDTKFRLILPKEFLVVAGSAFKRSQENLFGVSMIKHFENYKMDPIKRTNDIGIVKLSKPLTFSNKIRPIPLATDNPHPGSVALSTGWGQIKTPLIDDISAEILQGINISIGNFDACKKSTPWMTKDTFCAGTAGLSACIGDSGGPLVFKNTLVGVVSGGTADCIGAGIYTSVSHYHKWLLKAIESVLKKF